MALIENGLLYVERTWHKKLVGIDLCRLVAQLEGDFGLLGI
jgi:hypothetical protein